jgi:hypothetical protein
MVAAEAEPFALNSASELVLLFSSQLWNHINCNIHCMVLLEWTAPILDNAEQAIEVTDVWKLLHCCQRRDTLSVVTPQ